MPNVPFVPGVPPLASYLSGAVPILLTDAVAGLIDRFFGPHWGIFLNGLPVIVSSNTVSFDYRQDWSVSDYPVEEGAFQSYDKVQHPFDLRFRFSAGGSELKRQALLASVAVAANSLELFDVLTPETIYRNCNITHYDYRRTARNGVGLLVVDVWLVEVRVSQTATFTNTQQPQEAGRQGVGNVQPQAPTPALTGAVGGGFF